MRNRAAGPGISVLLLSIALWTGPLLTAQISPGVLSKAHHDLDGPLQCNQCHVFGTGKPQVRCLDCHKEIASRLAEKHGYHFAETKAGTGSADCVRCHDEHNGLNFRLVRWPVAKEKFDHSKAGWQLEGKHAQLKCAECHTAKYIDPQDRAVLKRKDLNTTFAGLDRGCTSCHRDVHAGQLSSRCTDCHSQDTWKNAPGFSHEKTRYALTGLHARVDCALCHRPATTAADSLVQFKTTISFGFCASCHKDIHGSAFGGDCARCHTTSGWKQLLSNNGFDHNRTDYPLLGKHAAAACRDCHKTENFKTPVAFARCLDCHKDQHGGQFARRADGGDCKACHTEGSWKPAVFSVDDHAKTAYPLLAKHAKAECAKCHIPKGKETAYRVPFAVCTECHQDAHKGQFAAGHNNRCEDCHDAAGWTPANYTMAAHNQTRFALQGAHVAVPCTGCHAPSVPPSTDNTPYHPASARCADCHKDPHGETSPATNCETCHLVVSWKERGRFDHSKTALPLLGRHGAVDCLACHKPVAEKSVSRVSFHGAPKDCAGCHTDVHGGQFRTSANETSADEKGCDRCHTVLSWKPTEFDHSLHSTFKLDGAHDRVPCQLCHNERRMVGVRSAVVYKGTPRECKQCHI